MPEGRRTYLMLSTLALAVDSRIASTRTITNQRARTDAREPRHGLRLTTQSGRDSARRPETPRR